MSSLRQVLHGVATASALLVGAVAVSACAAAAPASPGAPAPPEMQPQFAAQPSGGGIDGAAAELSRAETEMQRALAVAGNAPVSPAEPAQEKPSMGAAGAAPPPPPSAGPSKSPERPGDDAQRPDALSSADACSVACRALESMRRSTAQLCGLAGAGDARCVDASARVDRAVARVRASCPSCAQGQR